MRFLLKTLCCLVMLMAIIPGQHHEAEAWGFFAHQRINRMAVFTLPPELFGFYKKHIEYITAHAVDPDKRRYAVEGEAPRHYIDIDHYSVDSPFVVMPRHWYDAVEKYTEDTLMAYGILPWNVRNTTVQLTRAMEKKDIARILKVSADLGHYVADAHVPLHTTENYNGQMTGQKGVHGLWESRLPELFSDQYDYLSGRAEYIDNILDFSWETVADSHHAKDSVLDIEKELLNSFPADHIYSNEQRGNLTMRVYSRDFSDAFHNRLNGMVERRMTHAIYAVGCIWYTAWVNAGKPDLEKEENNLAPDSTAAPETYPAPAKPIITREHETEWNH